MRHTLRHQALHQEMPAHLGFGIRFSQFVNLIAHTASFGQGRMILSKRIQQVLLGHLNSLRGRI